MVMLMESKIIEMLLYSLNLDNLIMLFNENDIDFGLLMELFDMEVMGLLIDINLIFGN